eukprot:8672541-Heterocapsa_arctica.AAC.1
MLTGEKEIDPQNQYYKNRSHDALGCLFTFQAAIPRMVKASCTFKQSFTVRRLAPRNVFAGSRIRADF